MKKSGFRRILTITMVLMLLCFTVEFAGVAGVTAADNVNCSTCGGSGKIVCGNCGGNGHTTFSYPEQQIIGYNMGTPQYIYVEKTVNTPCTSCSGSGRMMCPLCLGTGRFKSGSDNTLASSANSTVIDATDGIGDYLNAPASVQKDTGAAASSTDNQTPINIGMKFYVGNLRYKITSNTAGKYEVCVIGIKNKKRKKITINSMVEYKNNYFIVTSIGKQFAKGCKKLKMIKISTIYLKKVDKKAFKGIKKSCKIRVPVEMLEKYNKMIRR